MRTIKIIREATLKDFETKINKYLSYGWNLKGNLLMNETNFVQILQKKIKNNNNYKKYNKNEIRAKHKL
ncbi:hypothetical protein [uncultured Chryseobacterium sp.]|uniref:hypothetical protein n=1 Tax=uncultured Chryseobacterium sp. TaxID=259322 RepID=UPI0025861448|nr:hypothetical protein [uncultured Chryseobacterium sp.]